MEINGEKMEMEADLEKVFREIILARGKDTPKAFYNMIISLGILAFIHFISKMPLSDLKSMAAESLPSS